MNIVFVNPPMSYKNRLGYFERMGSHSPPFNLCYLSAVVRENGYKPFIIDAEANFKNKEEVIFEILKLNPIFVGITAMTLGIATASELAFELKKQAPNIIIILGGVHVTALPEETMQNYSCFDFAVLGEGEETIIELLEALKNKKDVGCVQGVIFKDKNSGELIKTSARPLIQNLDKLPIPAFDLLPNLTDIYHPAVLKFKRLPSMMLSTSRGCPYKCIFCDSAVLKDTYRTYSVDYIINLIRILKKNYNVSDINFQDDTLTISEARINEFCEKISKEDITWSCQARVDTVNPEMLQKMKKAGCWSIAFGIETGNQEILDIIKKGITIDQIKKAVKWASDIGLETIGFLIVGNPKENEDTIEKTIEFICNLELNYILPWFFTPFPGTTSYYTVEKYGVINRNWDKMSCSNPIFIPNGLTQEDLYKYYKRLIYKFYARPKQIKFFLSKIRHPHFIKALILGIEAFFKVEFQKIKK